MQSAFFYGQAMGKDDKFQINYSWSSKRGMLIAYTALIAVISVALAMVVFLLWGVVTNS